MVDIEHKDIGAANVGVIGYVQSADPGAVGAGKVWIDTTGGTGNWVTKIRNAANIDWELAGGGADILQIQVFS